MKTLITAIIASLLLPTFGIGQDADLESSKAKAAVREYERTLEGVDKDYQKQLKDLEKSYQMKAELVRAKLITNLTAALEEEARKINLEEANKIKAVIDEKKKGEPFALRKKSNPLPQDAIVGDWMACNLGAKTNGIILLPDRTFKDFVLDSNGKFTSLSKVGKWTYNERTGQLRMWRAGWEGRYSLSIDGQLLSGKNQVGTPIWMVKLP